METKDTHDFIILAVWGGDSSSNVSVRLPLMHCQILITTYHNCIIESSSSLSSRKRKKNNKKGPGPIFVQEAWLWYNARLTRDLSSCCWVTTDLTFRSSLSPIKYSNSHVRHANNPFDCVNKERRCILQFMVPWDWRRDTEQRWETVGVALHGAAILFALITLNVLIFMPLLYPAKWEFMKRKFVALY